MKRTPLKAKTPLKRKTPLKAYTPLKSSAGLTQRTPLKRKQKTARKLKEPYHSIFTDNMDVCVITGERGAEPHHIFNKANKALSEKYGFMLPLRHDWHRGYAYSIHTDQELWNHYRVACQLHYITVLGKTKEDWIEEFGKWYEEKEQHKKEVFRLSREELIELAELYCKQRPGSYVTDVSVENNTITTYFAGALLTSDADKVKKMLGIEDVKKRIA